MEEKKGGNKTMKQSQIAIIIGAVIIVVGAYLLLKTPSNVAPTPSPNPETQQVTPPPAIDSAQNSYETSDQEEDNEGAKMNAGTNTAVPQQEPTASPQANKEEEVKEMSSSLVTYTASGYSPATLRIKKGTAVVFKNESDEQMWTASALHPTHTVYPGSDIKKCGTDDSVKIFDMCQGLGKGQQWSFTFNETGTWKYHNHLRPSNTGSIVVE